MKITNKNNLPTPFVGMASRDYQIAPNEYKVTSLLKGIKETLLERRHSEEIERDVSDMIWLLFGTAVHGILEQQQESSTQLKENRIKIDFDGYVLSGQFDLYDDATHTVTDYKTASVWKIIFGNFEEWRRQTLIYCYMLRKIGFKADKAEIVALLKDHSKRDAKIKADYPQLPVQVVKFYFTDADFKECEEWLHRKFREISNAEALEDNAIPACAPEDRYNTGDKYAVMKKGNKKALRVVNTESEAQSYIEWYKQNKDNASTLEIVKRAGEDKKCVDYCSCCEFCDYYKGKYGKEE